MLQGYFENNLPNGEGIFTYKDGTRYIGSFYNGKFHGYGKHLYLNHDIYEGKYY